MTLARCIIGIDPGIHGAIALVEHCADNRLRVVASRDLPLVLVNQKHELMLAGIVAIVAEYDALLQDKPHVLIERVHAAPGQGVSSMFRFGYAAGALAGIVTALGHTVDYITPQAWQKRTHTAANPDAARLRASEIYPDAANLFVRKQDHNRAAAALIATAGLMAA